MKKNILSAFIVLLLLSCNDQQKKVVIKGMDDGRDTMMTEVSETGPINPMIRDSSFTTIRKLNRILADDSVLADGRKPSTWAAAGIKNVNGLKVFILELQRLVAADNKLELRSRIKYPLKGSVRNYKDFYRNYKSLFTPAVKKALAKTNITQLYRNGKGVMIGDNRIWIAQIGNEFKITAIN